QGALNAPADELDDPRADIASVLAAEPLVWEAHFGAGIIARRSGDHAAAVDSFRRVLELWPDQPDALHELGLALLLGGHQNDAVRHLEAAAAARPEDAAFVADAGYAQLRSGNLPAARERLVRARELDATDPLTAAYLEELARVEALVTRQGPG
ncbi:MAG: tetratricopeptide repeat protein, partial [Chloroflexi bacterium]|nr:tetratricopeptide repeat protein [Chloroflexota bacterium]